MASLPQTLEFKPKFMAPGGKAGSMKDVSANLQSRGLKMIKRKETIDEDQSVRAGGYDPGQEQAAGKRLVNHCRDMGMECYECTPFLEPSSSSIKDYRKCSFFYVPVRFNSHEARARVLLADMTVRQVVYIGESQEPLGEPISLHGCKVDGDLVAKRKFHLWPKGLAHKPSLNHTLYGEDYRDDTVEMLKCTGMPNFPLLCVHEGVLSKRGKIGLTYTSRFGRLLNGMLMLYANDMVLYPKEGVCLVGPTIEKVAKNLIRITTNERTFQLKFAGEQVRNLWFRAMGFAKDRVLHERALLTMFNKTARADHQHARRRRKSLGSTSITEDSYNATHDSPVHARTSHQDGSPSTQSQPQQQQQHQHGDDDETKKSSGVSHEDGQQLERHVNNNGDDGDNKRNDDDDEQYDGGGGGGGGSKASDPPAAKQQHTIAVTTTTATATTKLDARRRSPNKQAQPQPQRRSPQKPKEFFRTDSSDGAAAQAADAVAVDDSGGARVIEIEVQLYVSNATGNTVQSLGLIEVDASITLHQFRSSIKEELDHVPVKFLFMRNKGIVSRSLEKKQKVRFVNENGVAIIKGFRS